MEVNPIPEGIASLEKYGWLPKPPDLSKKPPEKQKEEKKEYKDKG